MKRANFLHLTTLCLGTLVGILTSYFPEQAIPAPSSPPPSVHEYRLANGLKLFVKEDHRAPAVISQVWYKVGSSYEPGGITGISHALEHMMFRGTKKIGPGQFSKIIAQNGGSQNAFTYYDFTAYYQNLPSRALETSFKLESDRMRHLLLDETAFKKEIQVVMEERRMRTDDNPQALTYERFAAAAHIANPYHHPVIGWMSDLRQMKAADLKKWYKQWYAPNNALLVVVGDVNPNAVYALAKRYFGPLQAQPLPTLKKAATVTPLGKRTIIVKRPAKLPYLLMGYNTPSLRTASNKWEPYALLVLTEILSGDRSARFQKILVRQKQLANYVIANYDPYSRLSNLVTIQGVPFKGVSATRLRQAIESQIQRLQRNGVRQNELNRVKNQLIAGDTFKKDSMSEQANEIGALESVGLSWQEGDAWIKRIQAVTAAQVQAVARKYLQTQRLTVATLVPQPISGEEKKKQRYNQSIGNSRVH